MENSDLNSVLGDIYSCYSDKVKIEEICKSIESQEKKWIDMANILPKHHQADYTKDIKETAGKMKKEILKAMPACIPNAEKIAQASKKAFKDTNMQLNNFSALEKEFDQSKKDILKGIENMRDEIDFFDKGFPPIPDFLIRTDSNFIDL